MVIFARRRQGEGAPKASGSGPLRTVAGILLAFAALIAISWVALLVLFPPAKLKATVAAQLSSTLSREVRFSGVSIGLFPPVHLDLRGPALAEPGGFGDGAAFQARSVELDLEILPLFSRRIVVKRLTVDEPALHLLLRPDGSSNFDGIARPSRPGARAARPMDFAAHELSIRRGRLLIDDLRAGRRTAFGLESRIALGARGGAVFSTSGTSTISGLALGPLSASRLSDLDPSLSKLEWKIEHRGAFDVSRKRLALERLALGLGGAELALSGVVDDPGPRARLDLHALGSKIDLRQVIGFLALADAQPLKGLQGSGTMELDLRARGALGRRPPELTGSLSLADAAFRYPGAPARVEGLSFTARFAPDSLGIGNLAARVVAGGGPATPVRARLAVTHFDDPRVWFAVRGDVDLAAIGPIVAPKDTRLSGRAALDVSGQGRAKDPGSIALQGRARLAGVGVESPALPKRIEGLEGAITFSPAGAAVAGLGARAGKSSFTLDGSVTRPLALLAKPGSVPPSGVRFNLRSPYLDLAEILPVTPGAPRVPNASGGGEVSIARLINQRLDARNVAARVELEPGILAVPQFSLATLGGSMAGAARFDLREPRSPGFNVKVRIDSVEADALLSTWTPAKGLLHGALSTTLDLSGAGVERRDLTRTLTAIGVAAVANGTLGPAPALEEIAKLTGIPAFRTTRFRDAKLPFRIERGRVVTDPVVLDGPHGEWRLSGAIGFDGSLDYAVSTTVPAELAAGLGSRAALAAGALADPQGRILIDLRVSGTAKSPRVSWDPTSMRNRLAGRASEAIQQQRERLEQQLRDEAEARRKAVEDSARSAAAVYRKAIEDSLKRKARDVLKGFFGGPRDTAGK